MWVSVPPVFCQFGEQNQPNYCVPCDSSDFWLICIHVRIENISFCLLITGTYISNFHCNPKYEFKSQFSVC